MSSILDALKKVEQERTVVVREGGPILDSIAAPAEPAVSPTRPGKGTIQLSPVSVLVGVLVLVAVVAVVAIGVSLAITKSTAPPLPSRTAAQNIVPKSPAEGVPRESEPALPVVESGPPMKETETTAIVVPEPVVSRTAPEAAIVEPAIQVAKAPVEPPAPAIVAPAVVAAEVEKTRPDEKPGSSSTPEREGAHAETRRSSLRRETTPAPAPKPVKADSLPRLTDRMRVSLGLPEFKIRLIGMPTPRKPKSWAVVNMVQVYIDDYVPKTDAKVIAIQLNGIGIEIEGKRFFVEK